MKKKVLLTGAAGAIGVHIIAHLMHNTDWEIVALDSFHIDHKGYFDRITRVCRDHLDWQKRIKIFAHDLNAPFTEREIESIGKIDYILNLASRSDVQNSIEDPIPFVRNNNELMLNMLEYARIIKPKVFLHFSTDEIYGPAPKNSKGHKEWEEIIPSNPYCLLPDSKIITTRGLIKIKDFDISRDRVISHIKQRPQEENANQKFCYNYDGGICKIFSEQGEIESTDEHKFFKKGVVFSRNDGMPTSKIIEVQAKELKRGDYIMMNRWIPFSNVNVDIDKNYARFLGYFLGDGSYSKKSRYIRLADEKLDYLKFYKEILTKSLGVSKKSSTGNFGTIYKHGSKNCYYLQFASEKLRKIIDLKNKMNTIKQSLNFQRDSLIEFLAGFFDADAHYRYEKNKLISISVYQAKKETLDNIQFLLRKLGIVSRIRSVEDKKGYNGYILFITDNYSLRLSKEIPSFKIKKNVIFSKSQHKNYSKQVHWVMVSKIEKRHYKGKVYDLEIYREPNYLADYFIVHNSSSKACQEVLAIAWWRSYGIPLIITNTMNNFGEMQAPSKFPAMIQKCIENKETIKVHSAKNGEIGSRYYLHSRNVADAILFILKNVKPVIHSTGEIDKPVRLNIVGDKQINNLELVKIISRLMGKPAKTKLVYFHSSNPGHDLHYGLDGTKLKKLGWKSPMLFEKSMKNTIEWQSRNSEWIK